MVNLREKIKEIFTTSDLTLARLTVGLGSMIWATILLGFDNQFDRPSYVYLAQIASQKWWGFAFLIVGVLQFSRALVGTPISSGWFACLAAILISWLWCTVTVALALSINPPPATVSGNIAVALLSVVILIRAVTKRE